MKFGVLSPVVLLCLGFVTLCKAVEEIVDGSDAIFVPITIAPVQPLVAQRIVGGRNAAQNQFPYQISLRVRGSHICGGSIISRNYVVTAAHCVVRGTRTLVAARDVTIRAGSNQLSTGGIIVGVSNIISHPQYRNFDNDIALLKLARPLNFTTSIRSIPLARNNSIPPSGGAVIVSGWGRIRGSGPVPTTLQYDTLNAITNEQCRRIIGNVPQSILCLSHSRGNGVCQGDSGGPAVYQNQLVGVTNFVIGNCGTSAPDGYARITFHYNWLKQNSDV